MIWANATAQNEPLPLAHLPFDLRITWIYINQAAVKLRGNIKR